MFRCDREQIQMRNVVAEMHDGECRNPLLAARNHDGGFRARNKMLHACRRPRPGQSLFDEIPGHLRNFARIAHPRQTNRGEFRHAQCTSDLTGEAGRCGKPPGDTGKSFKSS